jgi:hypothetical protein
MCLLIKIIGITTGKICVDSIVQDYGYGLASWTIQQHNKEFQWLLDLPTPAQKCDEKGPVCGTCAALHITCYYDQAKPEWMDGGVRQEEMAERLKREVKDHRSQRVLYASSDRVPLAEGIPSDLTALPQRLPRDLPTPPRDLLKAALDTHSDGTVPFPEATVRLQGGSDCTLAGKDAGGSIAFGRPCTILLMFYLEHLSPYLFPFYNPSILQGGRAWILEMMISSPVVRQATLCQSSYFFSLARGSANDAVWEMVLRQTTDAFEVLRQALQAMDSLDIIEHRKALYGSWQVSCRYSVSRLLS